jgi:UDP-N-acetylglucosamine diphosphorylase / glucose-1-phosphate thymidylyltransferase / UDP-N-acetylgalactosamine diphosphorylase / glucosamine-1-phosphate N-acetyltransferase / galactosamine-1-phosphate N-acetyltransferase
MRVCVFEDNGVGKLQPLSLTRPAFDLRCGAATLLERQLRLFPGAEVGVWVRPELADLCRREHPGLAVNEPGWLGRGPVLLLNARWLAPATLPDFGGWPAVGLAGGELAFAAVGAEEARGLTADNLPWRLAEWRRALPHVAAGGRLAEYLWDLVEANAAALEQDYDHWRRTREARGGEGLTVVGPAERFLADPSARVEPLVLIDTTNGPVLIDDGAVVQAFSRLEGPCYVGPGTQLHAARVRDVSFGPQCRVGGEVESSIVQGYSNKAHEGFLGHSYLGEWVNLGAGTQTSDLRTDYGPVSVPVHGRRVDTGRMKVGSFVGDHVKTSMGVLFNTGSAVGPFSLLLASGGLLPKAVPPFGQYAHGRVEERTDLREMFGTAATVMARRGREWTEDHAEFYFGLYEQTAAERRQAVREGEQRRLRRVV